MNSGSANELGDSPVELSRYFNIRAVTRAAENRRLGIGYQFSQDLGRFRTRIVVLVAAQYQRRAGNAAQHRPQVHDLNHPRESYIACERRRRDTELILRQPELSPQYLIEVIRDGHLDALTVRVELAAGHALDATVRAAPADALRRNVKSYVGISVDVRVCEPNELPRSTGKAQRVVDRRP
jgi:hypothetical protein